VTGPRCGVSKAVFGPDVFRQGRGLGPTRLRHWLRQLANQVISKLLVKKQPMRWLPSLGARLLLQIHSRVLNDTLTDDYRRRYPDFTPNRSRAPSRVASHALSRSATTTPPTANGLAFGADR